MLLREKTCLTGYGQKCGQECGYRALGLLAWKSNKSAGFEPTAQPDLRTSELVVFTDIFPLQSAVNESPNGVGNF